MVTNEGSWSVLGIAGGLSWGVVTGVLVTAVWLVVQQSFVGTAPIGVAALAACGLLAAVAIPGRRAFGAGVASGALLCYVLLLLGFVTAVGS